VPIEKSAQLRILALTGSKNEVDVISEDARQSNLMGHFTDEVIWALSPIPRHQKIVAPAQIKMVATTDVACTHSQYLTLTLVTGMSGAV
jgi:hypothetical protein